MLEPFAGREPEAMLADAAPDLRDTEQAPVLVVRGRERAISSRALSELWQFREVLAAFVVRRTKVKYKQAVVGVGWAVLQPLLTAAIFAIFLGRFVQVPSEGVSYLLFALAGTVVWAYFSSSTSLAMESFVIDRGLLRKVYFPREILPLAAVLAGMVDLAPGILVLGLVAALEGIEPSVAWLALPLLIVILIVTTTAVSLFFSAVNVYYRDARHALPFILQLGMYASPVLYPLSIVPERWRGLYSVLNPLVAVIDGVRRITVHQSWPTWGITVGAFGVALAMLAISYVFFKRVERGFADHV